jgi:hypothetical protein
MASDQTNKSVIETDRPQSALPASQTVQFIHLRNAAGSLDPDAPAARLLERARPACQHNDLLIPSGAPVRDRPRTRAKAIFDLLVKHFTAHTKEGQRKDWPLAA